ncbi:MAG: UDP-3-O-(3-hydroxymyristoyl)glucosamine N-acyltransferase [Halioglobus sp.]
MYSLAELAVNLGLAYSGQADRVITGLAPLDSAGPDQLSFIADKKYLSQLAVTRAAAVILHPDYADQCPVASLPCTEPYVMFARASRLFDRSPETKPGIHPSAVVSPDSVVHASASVAAMAVIEAGAVIEEHVSIGAGVFVGSDSRVGKGSKIYPNAVLYHDVHLGESCVLHALAVLGSDGFGFAPGDAGWEKIYQLGGVRIGDRVEIGGGCTIDRGALEHTVIEDGVIIDNQVHIAHNCRIGKNTAIAACCGVAGSAKIGANCTFGGMCGVAGHIEICDNAHFTGRSMVTKSVSEPGSYSSGIPASPSREWRKNAVRFLQLESIYRRLVKLEKQ